MKKVERVVLGTGWASFRARRRSKDRFYTVYDAVEVYRSKNHYGLPKRILSNVYARRIRLVAEVLE